jgi:hypothetical protein
VGWGGGSYELGRRVRSLRLKKTCSLGNFTHRNFQLSLYVH